MTAILLCILANVGIFLSFRLFRSFQLNTFEAIVFNYITCVVTGLIFTGWTPLVRVTRPEAPWIIPAVLLGAVFIGTFYLMARTTQVYSMTVASIATKMSLVIPVLFSLLVLGARSREYSIFNYTGMVTALIAIYLSTLKQKNTGAIIIDKQHIYLPVLIFLLGGIIDTALNFVNHRMLTVAEEKVFPVILFAVAAGIGVVALLIRGKSPSIRNMAGGIGLGVVNYFSVYFLLKSLRIFSNDGAFVYPMINVGIILGAAICSALLFREKFTHRNIAGIVLAVISILLLSHQEITGLF